MDLQEWDGEFVVRSDSTAGTHRLSYLAGETIKALRQGPMHFHELAARVLHALDRPNVATAALVSTFALSGIASDKLWAVLANLEELDLVRRTLA